MRWDATDRTRFTASYAYFDVELDGVDESDEGTSPRNKVHVRCYADVGRSLELNAAGYYVSGLKAGSVPSYARFDLGLSWRPRAGQEIAIWGQNLTDADHVEFVDSFFVVDPIEIDRSFYAQASFRF